MEYNKLNMHIHSYYVYFQFTFFFMCALSIFISSDSSRWSVIEVSNILQLPELWLPTILSLDGGQNSPGKFWEALECK